MQSKGSEPVDSPDTAPDFLDRGRRLWRHVSEQPLRYEYRGPGFRFVVIGAALAGIASLLAWFGDGWPDAAAHGLGALALLSGLYGLRFLIGAARVGGLVWEVNTEGVGVGCGYDSLVIPWDAVDTTARYLPVNDRYMLIPVRDEDVSKVHLQDGEGPKTWEGAPYKRFILQARHEKGSGIVISSWPNEYWVHLLFIAYPMISALKEARKGHS